MRSLGEEREPGERPPAPGSLRLVQQYLNTYNHEFPPQADRLGTAGKASRWLASHGLIAPSARISESDRKRLVRAREALLAVVRANERSPMSDEDLRALNETGRACLSIRFGPDGTPRLGPASRDADGAMGSVLAACYASWLSGTMPRLKACVQCSWIFYDGSKNRSGAWCSMRLCGNRMKNRAYRRRRTAEPD